MYDARESLPTGGSQVKSRPEEHGLRESTDRMTSTNLLILLIRVLLQATIWANLKYLIFSKL